MSKSLFEEAIADAKQLRDVAEQNAKRAIVEAVTPKIKEFIERQLTGEGDFLGDDDNFLMNSLSESNHEEDEEDVVIPPSKAKKDLKEKDDDVVELSEDALKSLMELMSSKKNVSSADPLSEAFGMLSPKEKNNLLKLVKQEIVNEAEVPSKDKKDKMSEKTSGDKKMARRMQELYELDLDDLNEDKITIDFGKDIELDEENPYTVVVGPSDEAEEDVTLEEPPEEEEGMEGMEDMEDMEDMAEPAEGEEEEEEEAAANERMVYELDENVLRRELVKLREAKNAKKTKQAKEAKQDTAKAAAAFGGGKLQEMDRVVMNKFAQLKEAYEKEVRKNRALAQQLNEYRNGVETLREQLSELNLFNAKLLYVNKITQDREVTSSQRRAVVEALDGAKNLREAKLIYKSLSESLNRGNSASLNESARRLSPGQASRPTTSGGATQLNESTHLDRWATLAGIK
jgi:hypothetical protein